MLKREGRAAVIVNSLPERSLFTRICTVIAGYVPERAEQLNRYASIRTPERLSKLFIDAGFQGVSVRTETKSLRSYLSTTISLALRLSFPDGGSHKPFVVEMEVLVGSGGR